MAKKRKRKLRPVFKVLLGLICLSLVGYGGYRGVEALGKRQKEQASVKDSVVEEEPVEEAEPVVTNASMFMVGDSLLHTTIEADAVYRTGGYTFSLLDRIGEIARNYDFRYYNQETILGGDELGIHGYPTFNGPSQWGDYMLSLGFNMTSLANNHTLDQGIYGIQNSMNYWNSHPEMITSGTYLSQEEYDAIPIHEINGISYAFISYTYGMNGIYPPAGYEYMVACYEGKTDELLQKVSKAKEMADVVIVAMHWGTEYQTTPNEEQTSLARQLSDAGADIIVGNHPHCIQPIEWINDKTICFYALGNIVAAQYDLSRIEMMGALNIQKTTYPDGTSEIEIQDVKADLMYCYYDEGTYYNFDIIPFSQMDEAHLYNYQAVYEQYKPIMTQMTDNIQVGGF